MPGLLPDAANGGQIIRDAGGVCTNPPNVLNAYCPPAAFTSTCELTALPQDCTARIMPSQINGIVSELLCFAANLNPTGNWNCSSNCNLAAAFAAWAAANKLVDGVTIIGAGTLLDPWRVDPGAVVDAICADDAVAVELAACLISSDADNILVQGTDGKLYVPPGSQLADQDTILGNGLIGDEFRVNIPALISTDLGNELDIGTDGKLYINDLLCPPGVAACTDRIKVYNPDTTCKIIPHLTEPLEVSVQIGNAVILNTLDLKSIVGVGRANGIFTTISSLVLNNPDGCRPMAVSAAIRRQGTTHVNTPGPAFSWTADSLFDPGTGIMATNGLGVAVEAFPATVDNQEMYSGWFDFRLLKYIAIIPPGGSVTMRRQELFFVESPEAIAAIAAHAGPVVVTSGGTLTLYGRSL